MKARFGKMLTETRVGDITEMTTEAIVNAANSDLWMGSGVAGAIKRRGGAIIEREAMAKGPISPGESVLTSAGSLPSRLVIHCAGMPPGGTARYDHVKSSVLHGLRLVKDKGVKSIAFPAIGAGVGGLTMRESADAIIEALVEFSEEISSIEHVMLVAFQEEMEDAFIEAISRLEE